MRWERPRAGSLDVAFLTSAGGVTALGSHLVKAGARAAVNASPEPACNIAVSGARNT